MYSSYMSPSLSLSLPPAFSLSRVHSRRFSHQPLDPCTTNTNFVHLSISMWANHSNQKGSNMFYWQKNLVDAEHSITIYIIIPNQINTNKRTINYETSLNYDLTKISSQTYTQRLQRCRAREKTKRWRGEKRICILYKEKHHSI